jgi:hypothetical protein
VGQARDLPKVKGLIGMQKQQRQDLPTIGAKEERAKIVSRSH